MLPKAFVVVAVVDVGANVVYEVVVGGAIVVEEVVVRLLWPDLWPQMAAIRIEIDAPVRRLGLCVGLGIVLDRRQE